MTSRDRPRSAGRCRPDSRRVEEDAAAELAERGEGDRPLPVAADLPFDRPGQPPARSARGACGSASGGSGRRAAAPGSGTGCRTSGRAGGRPARSRPLTFTRALHGPKPWSETAITAASRFEASSRSRPTLSSSAREAALDFLVPARARGRRSRRRRGRARAGAGGCRGYGSGPSWPTSRSGRRPARRPRPGRGRSRGSARPAPELVERPGPVLPDDLVREVGDLLEDLGAEVGALGEGPVQARARRPRRRSGRGPAAAGRSSAGSGSRPRARRRSGPARASARGPGPRGSSGSSGRTARRNRTRGCRGPRGVQPVANEVQATGVTIGSDDRSVPEADRRQSEARFGSRPRSNQGPNTDIVPPSRPRNRTRDAGAGMGGEPSSRRVRPPPFHPRGTDACQPRTGSTACETGRTPRSAGSYSFRPARSIPSFRSSRRGKPCRSQGSMPSHDGVRSRDVLYASGRSPGRAIRESARPMTARTLRPGRRSVALGSPPRLLLAGCQGSASRHAAKTDPPTTACIDPQPAARAPDGLDAPLRRRAPRRARSLGPARRSRPRPLTTVTVQIGRQHRPRLPRRRLRRRPDPRPGRAEDRPAPDALAGATAGRASGYQVSVRLVNGSQSKSYYVLGTVTTQGRFPITGNETVLDAHPHRRASARTACPRRPTSSGPTPRAAPTRSSRSTGAGSRTGATPSPTTSSSPATGSSSPAASPPGC